MGYVDQMINLAEACGEVEEQALAGQVDPLGPGQTQRGLQQPRGLHHGVRRPVLGGAAGGA